LKSAALVVGAGTAIASVPVRQAAVKQATAKAALNGAPAYLYWFSWQRPMFDGRPQAFHCAELPFVAASAAACLAADVEPLRQGTDLHTKSIRGGGSLRTPLLSII
jgi:carboxylesterase type B